jgi:predicted AAA+ superfamily ATPase
MVVSPPFFMQKRRHVYSAGRFTARPELRPSRPAWNRKIDPAAARVPEGALHRSALDIAVYTELLTHPERLAARALAEDPDRIVIDEIQRLPALLDEVHRLIEKRRWRFTLTGSSARKLRKGGVNLLAGRARTATIHPLTAAELGDAFDLTHSVRYGQLPSVYVEKDPKAYLAAYAGTYLREEVQAEALTRSLDVFSRFLVTASLLAGKRAVGGDGGA